MVTVSNNRGRPKLWVPEVESRMHQYDLTNRTAQNRILYEVAAIMLEAAPEWVQRYYLGGRTLDEATTNNPRTERPKMGLLQELGRWPREEIAQAAEWAATALLPMGISQHEAIKRVRRARLKIHPGKTHNGPYNALIFADL